MTRLDQAALPPRQQPLCDRIYLAADADEAWRPDETWEEWCAWLDRPPTTEVYRTLQRACRRGRESFRSQRELGALHKVSAHTLGTILDDLARLHLIKLERARGTILAIEVNDPPPVPANIEQVLRRLSYNRSRPSQRDVRAVINYWCDKYEQHRKTPYPVERGKDEALVRRLLETYSLDQLKRLVWYLLRFGVAAEILPRDQVSIGTFTSHVREIAESKLQAERDEMRPKVPR